MRPHGSPSSPRALQYRTFEVVRALLARLAEDGPVAVALEDLHWADATSLQLLERICGHRDLGAPARPHDAARAQHPSWRVKETAARELPHRTRELPLEALTGDAGRELLTALVGEGTLPPDMEPRILSRRGNPFFLEEIVRSLVDAGALVRDGDGWRFDHEVDVECRRRSRRSSSRIDRLSPGSHAALMAASVAGVSSGSRCSRRS
jgi:predicted ATPase